MVNFSIMIPLLEVLFNQVDYDISKNIVNNEEFNFSIDYLKPTFTVISVILFKQVEEKKLLSLSA